MKLYEHFTGHKSGQEGEAKVKELIANGILNIGNVMVDEKGNKSIIEGFTASSAHLRLYVKKNSKNVQNKQLTEKSSFMQWEGFDKLGRRIQEEKLVIE